MTEDTSSIRFLADCGEAGALIAAFDWAATAIGPIASWPQSLKTATSLLLRSPVPIVLLWGEAGYMIYNDAYSAFAGARHPALLGSKVREGWAEVADFNDNVMRVGLAGGTLSYRDQELTLSRRGRPEQAFMNLDYSPVVDESGRPAGVIAIVVETTERVRAERSLRESEDRFRQMADSVPALIWACDETGRITFANRRYETDFGLPREEMLGEGWRRIVLPEDVEPFFAAFLASFEARRDFRADVRVIDAGGGTRWLRCAGTPRFDSQGGFLGYVGCNIDVTEARLARDELEGLVRQRTEDRDRMWLLSTDVMLVADFSARIQAVNPAWTSLLGWPPEELLTRDFMALVHPDDREATLAEVARLAEGATTLRFENRYRCRDGSYRWLSWTAVPDARFIHAVGRDVQAEKEAAEALKVTEAALLQSQKMEAVGQLTGGIAHDFNNLLAGIQGSLDLLMRRVGQGRTDDLERYAAAAQGATKRAAALTHRLLAFSRRQTLDPKSTDVDRLVADMAELVGRTVGPQIAVSVKETPGLWPTLVDPHQLENALLNLCINARDAMPGGGRLTLETENRTIDASAARQRDMAPGQYVTLCVSDTGTGMTRDVMEKAFEPFFTTKPLGAGTGLGLSMVYGFIRQSGGQVRIHSTLGQGTTICLYLPRHGAPERAAGEAAADGPGAAPRAASGETVLVVDDEPLLRMIAADVLEDLGYAALEAADGAAGLAILRSDARIDLLVTDVGLPGGMNGRQMADAARLLRPGLKVLFVTGYAEQAVMGEGGLEPGMHILTKPYAMETLAARIRELIAG